MIIPYDLWKKVWEKINPYVARELWECQINCKPKKLIILKLKIIRKNQKKKKMTKRKQQKKKWECFW